MKISTELRKAISASEPATPTRTPRFRWPLIAGLIGLIVCACATLKATPVFVPDGSFEDVIFPGATNALAPGNTGSPFNNAVLTPTYYWWGAGASDELFTNGGLNTTYTFPTEFIENDQPTNFVSPYPLSADGTMIEPGDGTNYLVLGGTGDENFWQPIGPLLSNTVYTLTVAVGLDVYGGFAPPSPQGPYDGSGSHGGGTALVALVEGNDIHDIFSPGAILASMQVDTTNASVTPGVWFDETLVFTNGYQTSGGLTILLRGTSGFAIDLDNIRLDATPAAFTAVKPTVTTDIGSNGTTVYQGTPVTLSENPVGVAPFTYSWLTDNGSGGATWTPVSGAHGATYVADTTGVTPGTSAEYEVAVTNGANVSISSPVTLSIISGAPVLVRDTLPSSGSFDVVGSMVGFSAVFDGSRPISYQWQLNGINISGATNELLNVALTSTNQSGAYSLVAANSMGTTTSAAETFTVNALPAATNNVILTDALEWGAFGGTLGYNQAFNPTWTLATNSLIAGLEPSSSVGIFSDSGCGGLPVLTDGSFVGIAPPDNGSTCFATAGNQGTTTNTIGSSFIYTLPATESGAGWTLTNITSYGGWSDDGREQQTYQVSYSSPLAPTNFSGVLPWTAFNPPDPAKAVYGNGVETATKMSLIPANGVLAQNVYAVRFNFYSLAGGQASLNGWEGYAQFQVFGTPSTNLPPAVTQAITPNTGSDVVGSSVTIEAAFASPQPITYAWFQDGQPMPGQTSPVLILSNLQLGNTATNPGYVLQASNGLGVSSTAPCKFVVNPAPIVDGAGILFSEANQAALGGLFTPTWSIPTNSLLAGEQPFAFVGNVADGGGSLGNVVLTDGQFGTVGESIDTDAVDFGFGVGSAGQFIYYMLPPSSNGWNISSISSYGGWSDVGRNQQEYAVFYSTVADPYNFIELDQMPLYIPPVPAAEPNATRVIWSSGVSQFLATNVAAIEFDFQVTPEVENAWEGYNELQVFGTAATNTAAVVAQGPIIANDIAPGYASNVVGSSQTFTALFGGSAPLSFQWQFDNGFTGLVNIPGATNETLVLSDLATNMAGSYACTASNPDGVTGTSEATLYVTPLPAATNGIIYACASQIDGNFGLGINPAAFTPTWDIAGGSLIAGQLPTTVGPGNFADDGDGAGGVPVLTDGTIGLLVSGGPAFNYATCGASAGLGSYLIYTLHGSASGYNINSIVTYGGWPDYGRDWQYYTVSCATAANPTNFQVLGAAKFALAQIRTGGAPNSGQVTWIPAGGGTLASNVVAVKFDFTTPAGQENGWQGYSELQVFGVPSTALPPPLKITSSTVSGGNLILAGSGGAAGANYYVLSTTNLALPLSEWTTNATGTFDISGNFSSTNTINHAEKARFFLLSTP